MAITIDDIKKLRNRTCCGVSDCKKALEEADGDFEKAVDVLRKKGLKVAAARSGMSTSEGVSISAVNKDNNFGCVILLSCETDFVSSNAMFVEMANKIVNAAVENKIKSLEDLKKASCDGIIISDMIVDLIGKVGENISLASYEFLENDVISCYTHFNKKIAVLVGLDNVKYSDTIATLGKNLAMQIAAYNPVAICRECVSKEIIDRETEIAKEQSASAKTPEIAQRMVAGRLEKFYKEFVLLEQLSMMDEKVNVASYVKHIDSNVIVKNFKRMSIN